MSQSPVRPSIRRVVSRAMYAAMTLLWLCNPAPAQTGAGPEIPLVYVLSTGGTIAGKGSSPTDLSNYSSGSLSGADLVNAVPAIAQVASVKVEQIANLSSSDLTTDTWLKLAQRINQIFSTDPKAAGVVVTHGTNTLEETAFFLHLTVKSDKPVVVVGSMRPATAISADGPLNLLNAVRTAVAPDARGKGALVVLNDEITSARDATKTNTYRVETFRGGELGLLGYVDEDRVTIYHAPTRRHTVNAEFDVRNLSKLPKVDILYSYIEPETSVLQALVAAGTKGIVFSGAGAGALSTFEKAAVGKLQTLPADTRPLLVRSSRVGNGRVLAQNEFNALGMIPGDNLNPQKARVLLMLALTKSRDPKDIARMFAEY